MEFLLASPNPEAAQAFKLRRPEVSNIQGPSTWTRRASENPGIAEDTLNRDN